VTPEQLAGMNAHLVPKFREVEEEDEYVSGSDDTNGDSPDENIDADGEAVRKRVKTQPEVENAPPKWSNPDPYTALPPPSQTQGPKKDIVETIRKAKNDQSQDAAASNPVKDNIDFISFDDDEVKVNITDIDEEDEDQDFRLKSGGGRKRAHSDISPDDVLGGEITLEWLTDGFNSTPWCSSNEPYTASVGLK
jgi:non-canonical poly(A) RNA polymerase PAPD5/7